MSDSFGSHYMCNYYGIGPIEHTIILFCLNTIKLFLSNRNIRGIEWSLKNNGSRQIFGGSRNLGVSNWSLGMSSS